MNNSQSLIGFVKWASDNQVYGCVSMEKDYNTGVAKICVIAKHISNEDLDYTYVCNFIRCREDIVERVLGDIIHKFGATETPNLQNLIKSCLSKQGRRNMGIYASRILGT